MRFGIAGLLVEREAGVPAPVDEEGEAAPTRRTRRTTERERVEPVSSGVVEPCGRRAVDTMPGREDHEQHEGECTGLPQQHVLHRSPISSPRELIQPSSDDEHHAVRVTTNTCLGEVAADSSQK
jgi:hypothetical protein